MNKDTQEHIKTDNNPCINPIEEQRKEALKHYQEASSAIHHWSGFVESAIKSYHPIHTAQEKKVMKIKAVFKGANGSEGYKYDMQYTLQLRKEYNGGLTITPIKDPYSTIFCNKVPYESFVAFLNNWDNIIKI